VSDSAAQPIEAEALGYAFMVETDTNNCEERVVSLGALVENVDVSDVDGWTVNYSHGSVCGENRYRSSV
jgi:hypothetical protein